jgi:broad specificity phosphatase PhoE
MNRTRFIFLRHAETKKNPDINAAEWELSDLGKLQAEEAASLKDLLDATAIYASDEKKTVLTAEPLARKLNLQINELANFSEVKRGDKFLSKEAFEQEKVKQLLDLDYKAFDGESGNDAMKRFEQGVATLSSMHPNETVLIATHGTILNIYFASKLQKINELPERWKKTKFCANGIIEDDKIVKDIIS